MNVTRVCQCQCQCQYQFRCHDANSSERIRDIVVLVATTARVPVLVRHNVPSNGISHHSSHSCVDGEPDRSVEEQLLGLLTFACTGGYEITEKVRCASANDA